MALPRVPAVAFKQKQGLKSQLNRISTLSEDEAAEERFALMDELTNDVEESQAFRFHAPSTQSRQDHHLALYKQFLFTIYEPLDTTDLSENEIATIMFPDDTKRLGHQMATFVMWVYKRGLPRATAAKTFSIGTMIQYRNSMLFWASERFRFHRRETPYRYLSNDMVRAIRFAAKKYGETRQRPQKTWLGLDELRQLLDFEAFSNLCIEYSEQHQVLWCIGRLTALRPGSLAVGNKLGRGRALVWRDFTFTRSEIKGQFHAMLTLDDIDIKASNDTVAALQSAPMNHAVQLRMPCPSANGIIFSVAHRMLVIALRRGLLEGISTVDELLSSDLHQITIRPDKLDEQLFFAGTPSGHGIDYNRPLKSSALTEVIQNRAVQLGYSEKITFYSIRRRAATDLVALVGREDARAILGHSPGSRTLERYYLNLSMSSDPASNLLQSGNNSVPVPRDISWATLALGRLDEAALARTRGIALEQLTRRMIMADESVPKQATTAEMRLYRRRVRRIAHHHLIETEREWQRKTITQKETESRTAALSASRFSDMVLKRALTDISKAVGSASDERADGADDDDDSGDEGGDLDEVEQDDDLDVGEPDLETQLQQGTAALSENNTITVEFERETDDEAAATGTVNDVPYVDLARSFMNLLLDNSSATYNPWSEQNQLCPVCQEDASVLDEDKAKPFQSAIHLSNHLNGNFHHPVSRWKRGAANRAKRTNGTYHCPYCHRAGVSKPFQSSKLGRLVRHILDSDETNTNQHHDELKSADDWYGSDFANADKKLPATQESTEKLRIKKAKKTAKRMKDLSIDLTPAGRQIDGTLPYTNGIVKGSHPPAPLPAKYVGTIRVGSPAGDLADSLGSIPPHLQGFLTAGTASSYAGLLSGDPYDDDDIVMTDYPRSAEDDRLGGS